MRRFEIKERRFKDALDYNPRSVEGSHFFVESPMVPISIDVLLDAMVMLSSDLLTTLRRESMFVAIQI